MNEAVSQIKLKCLFSATALKDNPFNEGWDYLVDASNWPYPNTITLSILVPRNYGTVMATYDVWKAPSGLYYVLKRHCQPWDGALAVFEEVK